MRITNRIKAEINGIIGGTMSNGGDGSSGIITLISETGTLLYPLVIWAASGIVTVTTGGKKTDYRNFPVVIGIAPGETVIEGAVTSLNCMGHNVTSLNISGCPGLVTLDCYENKITQLDLRHNTALERLDCSRNMLTMLDLSTCGRFTYFSGAFNQFGERSVDDILKNMTEICAPGGNLWIDKNAAPSIEFGKKYVRMLESYHWNVITD